jgi:hypothetical protein
MILQPMAWLRVQICLALRVHLPTRSLAVCGGNIGTTAIATMQKASTVFQKPQRGFTTELQTHARDDTES